MKKEDIIRKLENREDSTILSFPERGPWGSSAYRGNCSGWIPAYFIWKYQAQKVAEVFAGSGTTFDVCRDMQVSYCGIDLNPNPTRPGILPMNILDETKDLPDAFYDADMVFLHPPYPSIHEVKYSNSMWKDTQNLSQWDIQNMGWEKGMQAVNKSLLRAYTAMQPGAYEVILVGEIRSKGQYRSMYQNLALPGTLHQTFIKLQHNCISNGRKYGNSNFALTGHEMIAVIKKPSGYEIAYVIPKKVSLDIRDSISATWKDVCMAVIHEFPKHTQVTVQMILEKIVNYKKAKQSNNKNLTAKIRQTLQQLRDGGLINHISSGVWMAA